MTSSRDSKSPVAPDPLPPALSSMWRLCRLGYRHEPGLMLAAFVLALLSTDHVETRQRRRTRMPHGRPALIGHLPGARATKMFETESRAREIFHEHSQEWIFRK